MTMSCPLSLSVVVVAFNSRDALPRVIRSIREHLDCRIVVVDNGSSDGSGELARALGAVVIEGHGNVGFGAGVNIGIASVDTEFALVLNPDAPIEHFDSAALAAMFRVAGPFGVAAGHETERDGRRSRPLMRAKYGWRAELAWSMIAWFMTPAEIHLPRPSCPRQGVRFSGAAFIVSRREFLDLGGFDERLFLYHEDEELSSRYEAAGLPIRAVSALIVEHEQGTSSPRNLELIFAWQLLSLVEMVAATSGVRDGESVARGALWALHAIARLGASISQLPAVGRRAADKSRSAVLTVERLRTEAAAPPRGTTYPQAGPLVSRLLEERS